MTSSRAATPVSGSVHIKLSFVKPPNPIPVLADLTFEEIYRELKKGGVAAPPTEGVGTTPSASVLQDDGGISSDDDEGDSELEQEHDLDTQSESDADEEYANAMEDLAPPLGGGLTLDICAGVGAPTPILMIQPSSPLIETPRATATFAGVLSAAVVPSPPSPAPLLGPSSLVSPVLKSPTPSPSASPGPSASSFAKTTTTITKKIFPIPAPIRRLSGLGGGSTSPSSPSGLQSHSEHVVAMDDSGQESSGTGTGTGAGGKRRLFRKSWGVPSAPGTPTGELADPMVLGVERSPAAKDPLTPNTPLTPATPSTATAKGKTKMPKIGKEKHRAYSLDMDAGNDILGIVMLEIKRAEDLPRLKNMTRTSFDMDPFAVISFGKKVFRTRVVRHSLNPTWDEKLLFHVRRYETRWEVRVRVSDWDKISSNDFVGEAGFE
ncbi:hypothetical protein C0991_006136, partial [Blastosporella zonata]